MADPLIEFDGGSSTTSATSAGDPGPGRPLPEETHAQAQSDPRRPQRLPVAPHHNSRRQDPGRPPLRRRGQARGRGPRDGDALRVPERARDPCRAGQPEHGADARGRAGHADPGPAQGAEPRDAADRARVRQEGEGVEDQSARRAAVDHVR